MIGLLPFDFAQGPRWLSGAEALDYWMIGDWDCGMWHYSLRLKTYMNGF